MSHEYGARNETQGEGAGRSGTQVTSLLSKFGELQRRGKGTGITKDEQ